MILSFLSKDAEDSPQSNSKKGNSISSGQRGGDHTQLLQETATDSRRCWYVCMFSLSLSLPITYAHEQKKKNLSIVSRIGIHHADSQTKITSVW